MLLTASFGCSITPRTVTLDDIQAAAARRDAEVAADAAAVIDTAARRLVTKQAQGHVLASGEVPLDILVLSGGGEYGAFGAGFLNGWGKLSDPAMKRPDFDVVTGISTGSLIAPFALLGRDKDYADIESLYKEARPEMAVLRGLLFFLPWRQAFYDNSGLLAYIRDQADPALIEQIRLAHEAHKLLLIGTTDIDLGRLHIWSLAREAATHPDTAEQRFEDVLLASSAIPSAFAPVSIDGRLHVDGGAREMLFFATSPSVVERVADAARSMGLGNAPVRYRMWVIVNNTLYLDPALTKATWTGVIGRSAAAMLKSNALASLQRMQLVADIVNARNPGRIAIDFRFVSIPDDTEIPKSDAMFNPEVIDMLSKLGREMAAKPDVWQTRAPYYAAPLECAPAQTSP